MSAVIPVPSGDGSASPSPTYSCSAGGSLHCLLACFHHGYSKAPTTTATTLTIAITTMLPQWCWCLCNPLQIAVCLSVCHVRHSCELAKRRKRIRFILSKNQNTLRSTTNNNSCIRNDDFRYHHHQQQQHNINIVTINNFEY